MRTLVLVPALLFAMGLVQPALAASPGVTLGHEDEVVVSQGGVDLTFGDVDAFAAGIPVEDRAQFFNSPQRIESTLRGLLVAKQLANEARKLGLESDPEVEAEIARATELALQKARTEKLQEHFKKIVPDLSELAHERYLADPSAYTIAARVDVKHILISTKDRSDAEAKALAGKLYSELRKSPSQFDADVTEYSDDSSKESNHGLIENATSDQLVRPFRDAAAKLSRDGELTEPVKTRFGYHLIKAVKITPAKQRSFAEVKDQSVKKLSANWVAQKVQDHIDALRSKALDAKPDRVAALRTRYVEPGTKQGANSPDEKPAQKDPAVSTSR